MSDSPVVASHKSSQEGDDIAIVVESSSTTIVTPLGAENTTTTAQLDAADDDSRQGSPVPSSPQPVAPPPPPSGTSPTTASLAPPMDKMSVSLLEDSLAIHMDTEFDAEENTVPLPEDEVFAATPVAPVKEVTQPTVDNTEITTPSTVVEKDAPIDLVEGAVGTTTSPVKLSFSDPMNIVAQMEARQDKKQLLMHHRRTEEIHLKEQQLERALNEIKVREVALLASERAHGSLLQYDETVSGREQRVIEAEAKLHQRTAEVLKREQEVGRLLKENEKKYNSLTAPLSAREQEITRRTEDLAAKETDLEHRTHVHMRKMAHDEEALTTKERAARDLESRAREQLQGLDKKQQELDLLNGHLQKKQKLLRSEEQEIDGRERELALREQQATQTEAKFAGNTEKLEARESALLLSITELHAATAALDVRTSQLNAREQRLSAEAGKLVDAEKDIQFHTDALNEKEHYSARVMREASTMHDEAQLARSEAARELLDAQRIRQETDSLKAAVKRQQQQLDARIKSLQQRETAIKLAHYELEQRQQRFPLLRSQYLSGMGARSPTGRGGNNASFPAKRAFAQTPEGKRVASVYSSRVIRAVPLADELSTTGRASLRKSKLSQSLPPIHLGKGGSSAPQSAYDNPLPPMHNTSRPRLSPLKMGGNAAGNSSVSGGGEAANLTQLALTHKPSRSPPPPAPRGASPPTATPVKRDASPDPTPSSWGSVDTPSSCRFTSTTLSSSINKSSPMSSDIEDHKRAVSAQRTRRSDKRLAAKQARFRKRRAMQLSKVDSAIGHTNVSTVSALPPAGDALAIHRAGVQEYVATSAPAHDDTTFVAAAQQAAEMRSSEQFCNSLALKFQDHLQGIIEGRQHAAIEAPPSTHDDDDDISWEASHQATDKANTSSHLSSFRPSSKKAGISVYRDLSDDQVRELFSAYSNQDDAKTEYDFLLYRVLAQDPHLKAADGVPTPAQDTALVHRLASMQVLLEKASSASHEATSTLTASYATATLLAVQGRLRDLLTYRKELNMDALALIEEAICKS